MGSKTTQREREAAIAINSVDRKVFPWSVVCGPWSAVCGPWSVVRGLFSKNVITRWYIASEGTTLRWSVSVQPSLYLLTNMTCAKQLHNVFNLLNSNQMDDNSERNIPKSCE